MSRENVEIVKRGLAAFNQRDLHAFMEMATPDIELFPAFAGAVDGRAVRGREGIEMLFREIRDTWAEQRVIADEFRTLGDRVVALGRIVGRGKGSGVPVETPGATIIDFRDGKMARVRTYLGPHGEALRAAGLTV